MHCSASGENESSFIKCSAAFWPHFCQGSSCVSILYFDFSSFNIPFGKQADNNSGEIKLRKCPSTFELVQTFFLVFFFTP